MKTNRSNYSVNGELKRELKDLEIRYRDLAIAVGYSVQSVNLWMSQPLDSYHKELIKQGIALIEKRRHGKS